jgi:hypothetical protein
VAPATAQAKEKEAEVKGPTPRRLRSYVCRRLRLKEYLAHPGDGREQPNIPASVMLWALLIGFIIREYTFLSLEALVRSPARSGLGVGRRFGDDALSYFTERLDPQPTRLAATSVIRLAKRNKAFDDTRYIGLALDGTGAGRSREARCSLCRPVRNADGKVNIHIHKLSMISVVGTGLSLPFDLEPYGPGDCEYEASQRLLRRAVGNLGPRFADYVVGDGEYATAPFLHTAGALGLRVVARLKSNLPELFATATRRFENQSPTDRFTQDGEEIELWDADDFDPWETLKWQTVRVLRYRQHKPDGTVVEAYWLTDFPRRRLGSRGLYAIAKSRWEIENQGFNDAKNRYGLEHIRHHQENSLLVCWLLIVLAMTIERLYRQRYLRRGTNPPRTAIALVRQLRLSLGAPRQSPWHDTS